MKGAAFPSGMAKKGARPLIGAKGAARVGAKALARVKEWEDFSIVGETRGLGLAIGVEIVEDKETEGSRPRHRP